MWCENVLTVTGEPQDVARFRCSMRRVTRDNDGNEVMIPLWFGALLPRPAELDKVEESSIGLRGYQALYGDWKALLEYRWIRKAGAHDRASLIQVLERLDARHISLAQRYRYNESHYGFRSWYEWNMKHYGTKWEPDHTTELEVEPHRLTYRFRTWENPPQPWFELAKSSFPELTLTLTSRNRWKEALEADLDVPLNGFY